MKGTGIQWTDDTVNPTSGCDGCELWTPGIGGPCYAGNLHETRLAKSLPLLYDSSFSNVRLIPGRMAKILRCMDLTGRPRPAKPWLNGYRRKIFVGDLGDIFSAAVTYEFLRDEVILPATTLPGSNHDLLLLTKQPNRAASFATWLSQQNIMWPENVWLGTSITGRASTTRIKHLLQVPAVHRFLSLEPLVNDPMLSPTDLVGIDWMILGGESDQPNHPARQYDLAWARTLIALGKTAKIAVFNKQLGSCPIDNGSRIRLQDHHGGDWDEWEPALRVRQMPFTAK